MTTIARGILSSSSKSYSTAIRDLSAPISRRDLPQSISNAIKYQVAQTYPDSTTRPSIIPILNPFRVHKIEQSSSSSTEQSTTRIRHIPALIPRRRQKMLLEDHGSHVIPSSPFIQSNDELRVQWDKNTVIEIVGSLKKQVKKSVYGTRKRMFKGHKHERMAGSRIRQTEERLEGMDKRINEWKKTKNDTKVNARPSLPF